MKTSAQILLILALLSLLSLTFSTKVTVTKTFHTTKTVHFPNNGGGNGGGNGNGNGGGSETGSENEEAGSGSQNEEAANEETAEEEAAEVSSEFHSCDPSNRPTVCTLDYNPVCGYFHYCLFGICTRTFSNACEACSRNHVAGYVNGGTCKELKTTCDPSNRPEACPLNFVPTCAVAKNCRGPFCFDDVANSCEACSMKGVAYSLPGNCPANDNDSSERSFCDANNRPEICTADYNPVCAHISNCVGEKCWFTAGNACSACSNSTVDWHIPGECPGESNNEEDNENDKTFCDVNNRPTVCTFDYTPVCAHIKGCKGSNCWFTAGNACDACSNSTVNYHIPGECQGSEDVDDRTFCDANNRPDVCTADYTPVCAHISNCAGDNCWFTAGNACGACGNSTVDWHIPGECGVGDDRTYCDPNNRQTACPLDYTPVCAHTSSCTGDDCFSTAGNSCGACSDPNVDYWFPGVCPSSVAD